jgi:hypothetical protein
VAPLQMLFTGASVVAAINSILGGAGVGLLAARLGQLGDGVAVGVGLAVAVILFGLHLDADRLSGRVVFPAGEASAERGPVQGPGGSEADFGPGAVSSLLLPDAIPNALLTTPGRFPNNPAGPLDGSLQGSLDPPSLMGPSTPP